MCKRSTPSGASAESFDAGIGARRTPRHGVHPSSQRRSRVSRIAWLASVLLELLTACGSRTAELPASWDVEEIRDRVISTEGHGFTDLEMPRFRSADVEIVAFLSAEENRGVDLCLVKL